ncbi:DUF6146 family protein [Marinilabilia salmonicolor]|jgi:hypothetical protein|uniref:Lipoprotein n=1 Tax=Marinilabilia salmonicolor TaxID=989 RepID=A0A2T0XTA4_9BACT|nr:DUF6146 family protein [Marinilabilia salmonicolor]PRZ02102.1 hypothetical protein BY457_101123 [Marinilabilia salmonicolor]RCW36057.1 hypothetical protein DFO77_10921 [Marinilabilia salmonicolor]
MKKSNITQSSSFSFLMPLFVAMGLLAISVTSCKTTKKTNVPDQQVELKKQDHETSEDSTEYELIIMDSRFQSWLATQPSANFYSQSYYENWNHRYVTEWNHRHSNPIQYGDFYQTRIDYDQNTDYGLELNYKLYYYFRFIEKEYGIVLVPRGK